MEGDRLDVGTDEPISFERFQQCLHPDDRAMRERAIADAWVTGVLRAEYRVVRRDAPPPDVARPRIRLPAAARRRR